MSQARTLAHKQGYSLLQKGSYKDARTVLEDTVALHGPHVSILSDIAFASYLMSDMGSFRLSVDRLELEFKQARSQLSPRSRVLTLVSLAKFQEELGRVADALQSMEQAADMLAPGDPLEFKVRAQKLRLLASFGREDEIAPLYSACLHASESSPQDLIECYHALLLAEARLFGLGSAWPRFLALAKNPALQAADLRLCLLDLIEISVETNDPLFRPAMLEFLSASKSPDDSLSELDPFEAELFLMARLPHVQAEEQDFFRWTRTVSPLCFARLLALEVLRKYGNKAAARMRLVVALESFDHKTRLFLQRKWKSALQTDKSVELLVNPAGLTIGFDGKCLTFSPRAQPWDLLRLLAAQGERPIEEALQALGKSDSESERESLRIHALRLNKKLVGLAGVDWVIKTTKQAIQLNPLVRLQFPQA